MRWRRSQFSSPLLTRRESSVAAECTSARCLTTHISNLRGKWENTLAYRHRARMMLRRCEHHRLQNDWMAAPKHQQLWGQGSVIVCCVKSFSSSSTFAKQCAGVVACTRLAASAMKKPFGSYDFHNELSDFALAYLGLHGPESEEPLVGCFVEQQLAHVRQHPLHSPNPNQGSRTSCHK